MMPPASPDYRSHSADVLSDEGSMQISSRGAAFTRRHEGAVLKWYRDPVGIGTIGAGFTWASSAFREWWNVNKPGVKFGPGATMTYAEIDAVLKILMDKQYGAAVDRFLSRDVPQHVFDGMASAVFNLGEGALDWRWAQAAKRGDFAEAAELLRTTGTTAKGKKLPGLVRRRAEEANLIENGEYGDGGGKLAFIPPLDDDVLTFGEKGIAVLDLQRDLAKLGEYSGEIDGDFGRGTEQAVMAFQRSHGLTDDGLAGPKTKAAIRDALAPAPTPVETLQTVATQVLAQAPIARPDLLGRPAEVAERILRDEGSRTIAKANEVIKKSLWNRVAQIGPGGFVLSIFAGLGGVPWWVWVVGALALTSIGVVVFLSWRQAREAKAIKVARVDDAITGNAAFGGPSVSQAR